MSDTDLHRDHDHAMNFPPPGGDEIAALYYQHYQPRRKLDPESELCLALFWSALDEADLDWINRRDDYVFSFESCCERLGIDAAGARDRLNRDAGLRARWQAKRPKHEPKRRMSFRRAPDAPKRAWRRVDLRSSVVDIPGRSYDHAYGACGKLGLCLQCRERYDYTRYRRAKAPAQAEAVL